MLILRAVSYRYPGYRRPAIEGIDLEVGDGEIVGLVGQNEAGKSTLCLVAAGLAPGSIGGELTGEVLIDGAAVAGPAGGARVRHAAVGPPAAGTHAPVGIVFADAASQRSGVTGTVFEEVAFGPVNLGLPVSDTVARTRVAMAAVGIDDLAERHPERLSGGQAQLVAIASMLALRPRLLVLDEPVAELDPDGRRLVGETLRSLARAGTAILVAEHDMELLRRTGARIETIRGGRLEAGAGS